MREEWASLLQEFKKRRIRDIRSSWGQVHSLTVNLQLTHSHSHTHADASNANVGLGRCLMGLKMGPFIVCQRSRWRHKSAATLVSKGIGGKTRRAACIDPERQSNDPVTNDELSRSTLCLSRTSCEWWDCTKSTEIYWMCFPELLGLCSTLFTIQFHNVKVSG